jgi:hypothetical protein
VLISAIETLPMPDGALAGAVATREWQREAGATGGLFFALPPPPSRSAPSASALPAPAGILAVSPLPAVFDGAPGSTSAAIWGTTRLTRASAANADAPEWRLRAPLGASASPKWWG